MLSQLKKLARRKPEPVAEVVEERPATLVALAPQLSPKPETADTTEMAVRAEEAVKALEHRHEAWLRDDIEGLRLAWSQMQAGDTGARRSLFIAAHNLKGMAAAYGSPAVARICTSLCELLQSAGPDAPAALIQLHIEACRAIQSAGATSKGAETLAQTICQALEAQVRKSVKAA